MLNGIEGALQIEEIRIISEGIERQTMRVEAWVPGNLRLNLTLFSRWYPDSLKAAVKNLVQEVEEYLKQELADASD